jgi:hypothetical protein
VCCSEAADRGTPISRADQDLIIADAMKGTNAEFRQRLEESQKLLPRELTLPQSYVDLMLANPVVSRLWFAIHGLEFKRAVPGFRRVVAQEHAQEHYRHAEVSKGLMMVAQILMALPAEGCPPRPQMHTSFGPGRKTTYHVPTMDRVIENNPVGTAKTLAGEYNDGRPKGWPGIEERVAGEARRNYKRGGTSAPPRKK